jgi:UDP-N-acetylmuramoylalanine--D-glutamate ligase
VILSSTWRGKRYAVLGLARSGQATMNALVEGGAHVTAWDADPALLSTIRRHFGHMESPPDHVAGETSVFIAGGSISLADPQTLDLTGFTAVIVSPGVPLNRHPIAGHAAKYGVPIIGDIELFAQARAELPPHKVVGITGTNGKSTTTALVHHILKSAGVPTTMGGNIGLPILGQEPLPEGGVYVLELSSYQIDLTFTLDCDVAVLLNITPDHLDRYDGFEAYAAAKARLFEMSSGKHFEGRTDIGPLPLSLALQGPHNAQNAAAAADVCRALDLPMEAIEHGWMTYPGLPHRMERIRELNGVFYVNDSKATNADSTAPALAAYPAIHWIVGGQAKTAELDACLPHLSHVKTAFTIGRDGPMLAEYLRTRVPVSQCTELSIAVRRASLAAKPGETVLLSPACASFDQFKDYEDRGDQFRALVEAL